MQLHTGRECCLSGLPQLHCLTQARGHAASSEQEAGLGSSSQPALQPTGGRAGCGSPSTGLGLPDAASSLQHGPLFPLPSSAASGRPGSLQPHLLTAGSGPHLHWALNRALPLPVLHVAIPRARLTLWKDRSGVRGLLRPQPLDASSILSLTGRMLPPKTTFQRPPEGAELLLLRTAHLPISQVEQPRFGEPK